MEFSRNSSPRIIVIGTSPIMMIYAYHWHVKGWGVKILEQNSYIGGAWLTKSLLGFEAVEPGFHIIENRNSVYALLANIGIALNNGEETTYALYKSFKITYSFSQFLTYFRRLFYSVVQLQMKDIKYNWHNAYASLVSLNIPYQYPIGGAHGMNQTLHKLLLNSGIPINFNSKVSKIEINEKGIECETTTGRIQVDHLAMGSRSHAPLFYHNQQIPVTTVSKLSESIIIYLKAKKLNDFSCIRIWKNPTVIRVRDIGLFSIPKAKKENLLLCVQVRKYEKSINFINNIINTLTDYKLINTGAELIDFEYSSYQSTTIPDYEMEILHQRFSPRLFAMKTTDLGNEIHLNINR